MKILEVTTNPPVEIIRVPVSRNGHNATIPVLVDPGRDDLLALADSLHPDGHDRRIRGVHLGGHYYFWDGYEAIHSYVGSYLEWHLGFPSFSYTRITVRPSARGLLSWESHESSPEVSEHLHQLLSRRPNKSPIFAL